MEPELTDRGLHECDEAVVEQFEHVSAEGMRNRQA
jgi:hypothetical protein